MLTKAVVRDSELCVIKQVKIVFEGQSQTTPARTDAGNRWQFASKIKLVKASLCYGMRMRHQLVTVIFLTFKTFF